MSVTRLEVARRFVDVFGDSLMLTPAPAFDSSVAEPTWDMDVRSYETQDRVAHYVTMFTGRSKDRITERLERGTRYEPMIRAKMKAGGLPEDMYYLALVESGFDPNAYSRAAAVGMWQFMTSTARDMGMRVDWWVDERRDPVKSTTAAVRFIRGLRDQFGSLYLAAAAYNGGPGRVSRGLARYADDLEGTQGEDAFFVLADKDYLRNETREYVPQLIAAALIAKEPARYGMELHPLTPFAYDSARVPASTPLAAIAKAARVSTRGDRRSQLASAARHDAAAGIIPRPNTGGCGSRIRQRVRRAAQGGSCRHVIGREQEGGHSRAPRARARPLDRGCRRLQSVHGALQERSPCARPDSPAPDRRGVRRRAEHPGPLHREVSAQQRTRAGAHREAWGDGSVNRTEVRHLTRAAHADQRAEKADDLPRSDVAAHVGLPLAQPIGPRRDVVERLERLEDVEGVERTSRQHEPNSSAGSKASARTKRKSVKRTSRLALS